MKRSPAYPSIFDFFQAYMDYITQGVGKKRPQYNDKNKNVCQIRLSNFGNRNFHNFILHSLIPLKIFP